MTIQQPAHHRTHMSRTVAANVSVCAFLLYAVSLGHVHGQTILNKMPGNIDGFVHVDHMPAVLERVQKLPITKNPNFKAAIEKLFSDESPFSEEQQERLRTLWKTLDDGVFSGQLFAGFTSKRGGQVDAFVVVAKTTADQPTLRSFLDQIATLTAKKDAANEDTAHHKTIVDKGQESTRDAVFSYIESHSQLRGFWFVRDGWFCFSNDQSLCRTIAEHLSGNRREGEARLGQDRRMHRIFAQLSSLGSNEGRIRFFVPPKKVIPLVESTLRIDAKLSEALGIRNILGFGGQLLCVQTDDASYEVAFESFLLLAHPRIGLAKLFEAERSITLDPTLFPKQTCYFMQCCVDFVALYDAIEQAYDRVHGKGTFQDALIQIKQAERINFDVRNEAAASLGGNIVDLGYISEDSYRFRPALVLETTDQDQSERVMQEIIDVFSGSGTYMMKKNFYRGNPVWYTPMESLEQLNQGSGGVRYSESDLRSLQTGFALADGWLFYDAPWDTVKKMVDSIENDVANPAIKALQNDIEKIKEQAGIAQDPIFVAASWPTYWIHKHSLHLSEAELRQIEAGIKDYALQKRGREIFRQSTTLTDDRRRKLSIPKLFALSFVESMGKFVVIGSNESAGIRLAGSFFPAREGDK